TIMEKVRCMLSHANLDNDVWVEAATTASYLINRSPHRSLDGNNPEILWSNVIINSGKDFVPPHNVDNNHIEGKVEFEFDVENSTHNQPPFNDEHIETQDDGNMTTSPQSQPHTEYLFARDHERRQVNRPPRLKDYQCDLVAYAFSAAAHIDHCEPTHLIKSFKGTAHRCGDPNHLIGEFSKPPKNNDHIAFIGGAWSDDGEDEVKKTKDETCLVAQAPDEICLGINLEPDEWIKDSGCSKHMT
nr:retrovirus-related Pol polyprotein from transposon TNT 1-94 [Tanacetum cinerariifolium]